VGNLHHLLNTGAEWDKSLALLGITKLNQEEQILLLITFVKSYHGQR
jgi:hypothetical protein